MSNVKTESLKLIPSKAVESLWLIEKLRTMIKDEGWVVDKSYDFDSLDLLFTLEVRGKGVSHNGGGAAKGESHVD
jgi:hypothetical protein